MRSWPGRRTDSPTGSGVTTLLSGEKILTLYVPGTRPLSRGMLQRPFSTTVPAWGPSPLRGHDVPEAVHQLALEGHRAPDGLPAVAAVAARQQHRQQADPGSPCRA